MDLYTTFCELKAESENLIVIYQEMIEAETFDSEYGQLIKSRLLAIRLYMGFILEQFQKVG